MHACDQKRQNNIYILSRYSCGFVSPYGMKMSKQLPDYIILMMAVPKLYKHKTYGKLQTHYCR